MPVPTSELPILEHLVNIRVRLTALKSNRDHYIKAASVLDLYRDVTKLVARLNEIREANERSMQEEAALEAQTAKVTGTGTGTEGSASASTSTAQPDAAAAVQDGTAALAAPTPAAAPTKETHHQQEMNRVDTTLADVFQLLSLFFLTIGKSRSAPATYCQLATMMKLLDHMKESGIYTMNDLQPFRIRLKDLKAMITAEADLLQPGESDEMSRHPDQAQPLDVSSMSGEDPEAHNAMMQLLMKKHDRCQTRLEELLKSLSVISVDLVPLHQKLITLRRQLIAMAARSGSSTSSTNRTKVQKNELDAIAEELRKIEQSKIDGKFFVNSVGEVGREAISKEGEDALDDVLAQEPPAGQAILSGILEETFEILQEMQSKEEEVSPSLLPIYERLTEMRAALEKLSLTHRWTLRETDLYNFQVSLQEIDRMRVDGKFVDAEGNKPHGQRVLLYNLRRCYGLIYRLMSSSEPISEELVPIANKLATVRRCLNEVLKFGGPFSARDLYPYQLALAQIEALRVDGKFVGRDGSLPEGQGVVNATLSESHEIIEMLKEEMDQD